MDNICIEEIYKSVITSYKNNIKQVNDIGKKKHIENINIFIKAIRKTLLPEFYSNNDINFNEIKKLNNLLKSILKSTKFNSHSDKDSLLILKELPKLRNILLTDIEAAFTKDPAAKSYDEIALTYPGVFALMIHRISHLLFKMGYILFARMLSEHAHSTTGIDIHPGATIGNSFFMDHGTGIVIGETSLIGNNVTIYQNVTLGAFSFLRDEKGELIKGTKRHPTIEDNVTIYAGATILGGETIVGNGAIIGGNVWLTDSVLPNSKVITKFQNEIFHPKRKITNI